MIFAIGFDIIFEAAFNILGGRESMPVAFLGFRESRCFLISLSVICLKLKVGLFDDDGIFLKCLDGLH